MDMKAVLPLLSTILQQQQTISDKLLEIILTLRQEQDPVEPTLGFMLQPLKEGMQEMSSMLSPSSNQDSFSEPQ
jgi:ferritin